MIIKKTGLICVTIIAALGAGAKAQTLPPDFPLLSIAPNTDPAPGCVFGTLSVSNVPTLWSNWFAVLNNDGSPVLTNRTDSLGKLACNGLFVTREGIKGGLVRFLSKDSSFNVITTNQAGNGYLADNRDLQVLPNGHSLLTIVDQQIMDLSAIVPGGNPAAKISQNVVQELDKDNNVVFQWRILDHIPITDSYQDLKNPGSYAHVNSVWFDELDGTIILSCRNTSEVIKISRVTGEVIWRLQGKQNQFAFSNGIPGNSDPAGFQVQHSASRLPNGNITIFDNGYSDHSDPAYDFSRPYSRAAEYEIDEINKTAKLVWQFRHTPDIITYNGGSVERLPGGHTIIQWGNDNNASPRPMMTEANENGNLVCDVTSPQAGVSGSFNRVRWPIESTYLNVTKRELSEGNEYVFTEGGINTGVTMDNVEAITGDQYNSVVVSRQPFAPVLPDFGAAIRAPRVLPVRVMISQNLVDSLSTLVSFDVSSFGIKDPDNTLVYYRETPGEGLFVPLLNTEHNSETHQLKVPLPGFGEFIFGFPDVPEVAYAPILITPKPEAAVNQNLPVSFFWTPKGFAAGYHLQVSTDANFATLVVDRADFTESRYTNFTVAAGTRYYWRVNTSVHDEKTATLVSGDWATNSFTTVAPMVQVISPNGGEAWQRGLAYTIRWNANVAENIALDLYTNNVFARTITTNAAVNSAYVWTLSTLSSFPPCRSCSIRIRSTTTPTINDSSDAPFSIINAPTINAGSVLRSPEGVVQFGYSAPGAAQISVMVSTNLTSWDLLETLPLTSDTGTYIDSTAAGKPNRFYKIRVP